MLGIILFVLIAIVTFFLTKFLKMEDDEDDSKENSSSNPKSDAKARKELLSTASRGKKENMTNLRLKALGAKARRSYDTKFTKMILIEFSKDFRASEDFESRLDRFLQIKLQDESTHYQSSAEPLKCVLFALYSE